MKVKICLILKRQGVISPRHAKTGLHKYCSRVCWVLGTVPGWGKLCMALLESKWLFPSHTPVLVSGINHLTVLPVAAVSWPGMAVDFTGLRSGKDVLQPPMWEGTEGLGVSADLTPSLRLPVMQQDQRASCYFSGTWEPSCAAMCVP